MKTLLIYNEDNPTKSGMYVGLYHGRMDPNEEMEDWGFNGPIIGPISFFHTTYSDMIQIGFESSDIALEHGFDDSDIHELTNEAGMIKFDHAWYGDWTVFYHTVN